ncbi:hypothetical protein [uncultured Cohaesibacter sp.]|uniref:hypothetical protein n=1 Tax=uncultured Cohaesibacter sp. TaxID=1002546 RepID=UPI0029314088|nr:hypothetical protein [uncultured Cohaesibacter sp.]
MTDIKFREKAVTTGCSMHEGWRSSSRAMLSLTLLGTLGLGLVGCSGISSSTYGTGVTHEKELLGDVTNLLGALPGDQKKTTYDYQARAGLVLPPDGTPLPDPESVNQQASYNQANWPQDPDTLRQLYNERLESMTDEERAALLAAIRRLPPEQRDSIIKNNTASSEFARSIQEPDLSKGPAAAGEMREYQEEVKKRLALIKSQQNGDPAKRAYLTQPPERFTNTSPEVQAEMERLSQESGSNKEKKSFFARLWPFRSGS